jgi:hypothetical protein
MCLGVGVVAMNRSKSKSRSHFEVPRMSGQ